MKRLMFALLGATALTGTAYAQDAAPAEEAPMTAEEAATQVEFLKAQVEAMQAQLDELKKASKAATPNWKGAPQFEDKEAGWSFKVRGRFQYDTAYISNPENAIPTKNLGFNSRVRRVRLGVEGSFPGDFGYKFEADFANAAVGFGDVVLSYTPKGKPWSITIGNQESLDGLEQITSSRFISFMERSQFNDAFNNTRRLGVNLGYVDSTGVFRVNVGAFTFHSIDSTFNNDGWIGAARVVYAPQAMGGQLHFGANYQHRKYQSTTLSNNYQARPFQQTTDQRFVATTAFGVDSDDIFGLEAIGIFGPLHVTAEGQYLKVNALEPGDRLTGGDAAGVTLVPSDDPSFWGFYAEVGYFLTGETRGYKNGLWDRTKVLNPFDKGGWGAFQINARYDYLDLNDRKLQNGFNNNFTTGASTASVNLARGGTQTGYLASLIWIPMDYVRFMLNYTHTEVEGGPFAAVVKPTSTKPINVGSSRVDLQACKLEYSIVSPK